MCALCRVRLMGGGVMDSVGVQKVSHVRVPVARHARPTDLIDLRVLKLGHLKSLPRGCVSNRAAITALDGPNIGHTCAATA